MKDEECRSIKKPEDSSLIKHSHFILTSLFK